MTEQTDSQQIIANYGLLYKLSRPDIKKKIKNNIIAYTFLAPGILLFLFVGLYSVVFSLKLSFYDWSGVDFSTAKFQGFNNFANVLFNRNPQTTIDFRYALFNNVKVAFFSIMFVIPISLVLAFFVQKVRGAGIFRTIFFIPMVASSAAVFYAWKGLFNADGTLNAFFSAIKLDIFVMPEGMLGSPDTALMGIIIVVIWMSIPGVMILYYAGLSNIDESIYEAAEIEGAGKFTIITKITWPLLKPVTIVAIINLLNGSFQMFDNVFILTGGGPAKSTDVAGTIIYTMAFKSGLFGNASAMGWVVFAITVLIAFLSLKTFAIKD